MSRTPEEAFSVALFHFEQVAEYVSRDLTDPMAVDAIAMRLSAGIEAMCKLDAAYLDSLFEEWHGIRGMRNRIVHGYIVTDSSLVIESAVNELPTIVEAIRAELGSPYS